MTVSFHLHQLIIIIDMIVYLFVIFVFLLIAVGLVLCEVRELHGESLGELVREVAAGQPPQPSHETLFDAVLSIEYVEQLQMKAQRPNEYQVVAGFQQAAVERGIDSIIKECFPVLPFVGLFQSIKVSHNHLQNLLLIAYAPVMNRPFYSQQTLFVELLNSHTIVFDEAPEHLLR